MKRTRAAAGAVSLLALLVGCGADPVLNTPPIAVIGPDRTVRPGVDVELRGDQSRDPDGTIVRYAWSFGDGESAEGEVVTHAWANEGIYAVTLLVEDDRRAQTTTAIKVTVNVSDLVNRPPTAVIEGAARGGPGQTLNFTGGMSADSDGTVVAFDWDFGDGATATGSVAAHAWAAVGTYELRLVVTDDDGDVGRTTRSVVIEDAPLNQPPVAFAGPDVTTDLGVTISFNGSGSIDPDGSIVAYAWDFGDGTPIGATPTVTHAFTAPGDFTVTLTVRDDGGASASDSLVVTVRPPPSYDGNWIMNPSQGSQMCTNSHHSYLITYPAAEVMMSGSTTQTVTITIPATGRTMTGTIDRTMSPPQISVAWTGNVTEAPCGTANVSHRLVAKLPNDRTLNEGRFTVIYDWPPPSDPFCNCAKTFDVTGARR